MKSQTLYKLNRNSFLVWRRAICRLLSHFKKNDCVSTCEYTQNAGVVFVFACACTCCVMPEYVGPIYCMCRSKELHCAACTIRQLLSCMSVISGEAPLNCTPLPSCECVKMERVLLLKGMRGAGVIGHDCYQTLTLPLIMYDNRFFLIPPCFHGCTSHLQPCKYQIVCHHFLCTLCTIHLTVLAYN